MFKRLFVAMSLAGVMLTALALPTVDAVQAEVQRGNYAQAEVMMQDVVAAKPGSARAHYIYAEILAHNKRFDQAAAEAARARQIDPAIGFADPVKFKGLEQLLERERSAVKPRTGLAAPVEPAVVAARAVSPAQPSGGVPSWVWVLGLAGIGAVAWSMLKRRPQSAAPQGMMSSATAGAAPMGYGSSNGSAAAPGYPQAAPAGRGLLGVGLAAAGGLAAGMMAEKLLHGGQDRAGGAAAAGNSADYVPGLYDDNPAARELEQRPVDFGNGDGWDGGGADEGADGW